MAKKITGNMKEPQNEKGKTTSIVRAEKQSEAEIIDGRNLPKFEEQDTETKLLDGLKNISDDILGTISRGNDNKHKERMNKLGIDKNILYFFGIAFLGILGFVFYLIIINNTATINTVFYPLLTAILGFMSGYFAGVGRGTNSN